MLAQGEQFIELLGGQAIVEPPELWVGVGVLMCGRVDGWRVGGDAVKDGPLSRALCYTYSTPPSILNELILN